MPRKYTRKRTRRTRRKRQEQKQKQFPRIYMGGDQEKPCVFINMIANEGLGNQLFMYAAGLVASKKTGLPVCLIRSQHNPHTPNNYTTLFKDPSNVEIIDKEADVSDRLQKAETILNIPDGHATGKWSKNNIKYSNATKKTNARMPFRYFQNYSAVEGVIDEVKKRLTDNEFHKKEYEALRKSTDSATSAFVHVRRGDYVGAGWDLKEDYYKRAVEILKTEAQKKNTEIKTLWIISTDREWCESIWGKETDSLKYYVSKNELEALYKMMLCEAGAVISASTFSSWGAMMGPDRVVNSTIVYPLNWLTHDNDGDNPLNFPDGGKWIGIPNTVPNTDPNTVPNTD